MKPIDEQHIAQPGLVVLNITGGGAETVRTRHGRTEGTLGDLGHRPCAPKLR
ncbi:hypothetical protein ACFCV9_05780 [Streptomyces sp. NPDC056367]|uniref:hypothetical protein n=1 Tax=unclassified Streptomyces TaxID=2593676 RepID=UPI0035E0AA3B